MPGNLGYPVMRMNPGTRRKVALAVAGTGLAMLAASAGMSWQGLAAFYHLHLLERNPNHFAKIIKDAEGSPRRRAVREFLRTPKGASAFLSLLLDQYPDARPVLKGLALGESRERGGMLERPNSLDAAVRSAREETLRALWDLLDAVLEREVILPEHQDLRFVLVRWIGGVDQSRPPGYWSGYVLTPSFPAHRYQCMVRRRRQ